MTKIEEALKNLGLNGKQVSVYLTLLQLGNTTAYKIAQKSGLKRPTVYVILEELRQKDLILKIPYPKKQIYSAKSPEGVVLEAKRKINEIASVLPELLALEKKENKPSVSYFDNINGIKELLNFGIEKLKDNELVGFNAHSEGITDEVKNIFREYNEKLKKMNVNIRGIVPDHPSLKEYREKDEKFGRKIKVVPFEKYSSGVSVDIGPDFVKILMFNNLQGVLIENQNLATALRQIFEMQWNSI